MFEKLTHNILKIYRDLNESISLLNSKSFCLTDAVVRTMLFVILWMALVHVATASPARYVWTNVSAQTGHHASLMVHVLVNRDGLDKDVTNHVLLVRSELGVHRNAYVKTEHTVIRQMEPALVHQVGWGMSVMSNVRRGITDLTAEMCVLA